MPCTRGDQEWRTGLPTTAKIAVESPSPVGGRTARRSFTRIWPGAALAGSGIPGRIAGAAYVKGEPKIGARMRVKLPFSPLQKPIMPPRRRTKPSMRRPSAQVRACVTILTRSPS